MALGDIHCTFGISKTQRSSKTGFLFFLLLQMSLLSEVRPESTTDSGTSTSPMSGSASTDTMGVSSSTKQVTSTSASVSSVTAASFSSSSSATVSSVTITSTGNATSSTGNSSMISCPAFVCTSDCYGQYMNTSSKPCSSNASFCEIIKQDTSYSVGCSDACGWSCGNTTLSNCTVSCCSITNCLYNTIYNISNPFSTAATTKSTTTTTTTKATPVATTQATNGKKCHAINCGGAACYKTSTIQSLCAVSQDYCMLKKTTSGSTESWEGGCSTDCRKMTACSATTTTSPCYLECCNATVSSCLKLTGDVNMPSSATRGPQSPALITASILLFWILRAFT